MHHNENGIINLRCDHIEINAIEIINTPGKYHWQLFLYSEDVNN